MSNNIVAIFACHTTCMKKYVTTLSNLYNIYSFIDNFMFREYKNIKSMNKKDIAKRICLYVFMINFSLKFYIYTKSIRC